MMVGMKASGSWWLTGIVPDLEGRRIKKQPLILLPLPIFLRQGPEKIPGEVLVEEDVMIVRSSSGRVLAKGTAYLDKDGNIVNIRIRK